MTLKDNISRAGKRGGILAVFTLLAFLSFMAPKQSFAQCEVPGVTLGAAAGIVASNTASLYANYSATPQVAPVGLLPAAWTATLIIAQKALIIALKAFETTLFNRLRKFWDDYLQAMKDQTAEINGSLADGTRQLNSLFDTGNMTSNQRTVQSTEMTSKKQYLPTDAGCRFDTAANYMATTTRTSRAMTQGLGDDYNRIGLNEKGADGAKGKAQLERVRWERYQTLFCDSTTNGGKAGCPAGNPLANAHVTPSKTIFGRETIPMDDATNGANWKLATNELIYNITGYQASEPSAKDSLESSVTQDKRAEQRAYATQMDVVGSLVYGVIGDRTPGPAAPEVKALRQKEGIADASDHPSDREIRQSVIEQLWDPNYYVDLGDSPSTTGRKEMYLAAYNLMLLYKIIDKTERIANAFAVTTSNILDRDQGDKRSDQMSKNPIR